MKHVVVIGVGAIGAVSAIEAIRAGCRVTLLDPGEPGGEQAASYGNAGWLSSHSVIPPAEPGVWKRVPGYIADPLGPLAIRWRYLPRSAAWLVRYLASGWTEARVLRTAEALRALLVGAPALHAALAAGAGVPALIEQRGLLQVYPARETFLGDALAWRVRAQVGIRWEELSAEALRACEPDLDPRYRFGVRIGEAGSCRDPGAYVAALAAHAQRLGAARIAAPATGFAMAGERLQAVTIPGGSIACDAAVIAAGARSGPLAAALGERLPLESERGYHAMVDAPAVGPRTPLMASDTKLVANWTDRGVRAAGQVEIAGLAAAPDWRRAEILRDRLATMFPGLGPLPPERVRFWLGHRPSMPDGRPCLGFARRSRDVVYAFGHGHVGLVGAARTGRLVAQLLTGVAPEIGLEPFSPQRF